RLLNRLEKNLFERIAGTGQLSDMDFAIAGSLPYHTAAVRFKAEDPYSPIALQSTNNALLLQLRYQAAGIGKKFFRRGGMGPLHIDHYALLGRPAEVFQTVDQPHLPGSHDNHLIANRPYVVQDVSADDN